FQAPISYAAGAHPWSIFCADLDSDSDVDLIVANYGSGDVSILKNLTIISMHGDADGDGKIMVSDVIYLINYLFRGGPVPLPLWTGDVNCDTKLNISDVVYLISYLFKGGPPPCP
ncbi:MAG: dockerin type I repeat-containing protein, partial [candidate division Zixibacteria bacterium]|nr:dockerin type I repeat-containing protein [candidate division Zixibacteria bacterium]